MAPFIARIRALFQKNPRIQYALLGVVLVLAIYLVVRSFGGGARPSVTPVTRTPPTAPSGPAATPAPPPTPPRAPGGGAATPAPGTPKPPKEAVVPSGPTGRPDPFIPLFAPPGPGQTLPPPPFPGQGLPPPPLPGQGAPGLPGGGIAITGIVGDSRSVAIVNVGGRTEILAVGEQIGDMRVVRIDPARRVVTFLQAGRRFDVSMGGE
jgi:hypothetical protein